MIDKHVVGGSSLPICEENVVCMIADDIFFCCTFGTPLPKMNFGWVPSESTFALLCKRQSF